MLEVQTPDGKWQVCETNKAITVRANATSMCFRLRLSSALQPASWQPPCGAAELGMR